MWENSYIKKWLNNEFLNTAFSDDEKEIIIEKGQNIIPAFSHPEKITILDNKQIKKFFGERQKKIINNHTKSKLVNGDYVYIGQKRIEKIEFVQQQKLEN